MLCIIFLVYIIWVYPKVVEAVTIMVGLTTKAIIMSRPRLKVIHIRNCVLFPPRSREVVLFSPIGSTIKV